MVSMVTVWSGPSRPGCQVCPWAFIAKHGNYTLGAGAWITWQRRLLAQSGHKRYRGNKWPAQGLAKFNREASWPCLGGARPVDNDTFKHRDRITSSPL